MSKIIHKNEGFTIIEVVLVLAIAGLIFLVVFLSIGALQRSQRDSQRKSDLGRMMSYLTTYAANHSGVYPGSDTTLAAYNASFITNNNELKDPTTGNHYTVIWGDSLPDDLGEVYYNVKSRCSNGGIDVNPSGKNLGLNNVAIAIKLESGTYCIDTSS